MSINWMHDTNICGVSMESKVLLRAAKWVSHENNSLGDRNQLKDTACYMTEFL